MRGFLVLMYRILFCFIAISSFSAPSYGKAVCRELTLLVADELYIHGIDVPRRKEGFLYMLRNSANLHLPPQRFEKVERHLDLMASVINDVWRDLHNPSATFSGNANPSVIEIAGELKNRLNLGGYSWNGEHEIENYLADLALALRKHIRSYYSIDEKTVLASFEDARLMIPDQFRFSTIISPVKPEGDPAAVEENLREDFISSAEQEALLIRQEIRDLRKAETEKRIGLSRDEFSNILEAWIGRRMIEENNGSVEAPAPDDTTINTGANKVETWLKAIEPLVHPKYRADFEHWYRSLTEDAQGSIYRTILMVLIHPRDSSRRMSTLSARGHDASRKFVQITIESLERYRLIGKFEGGHLVLYSFGLRRDLSQLLDIAERRSMHIHSHGGS